MRGIVTGLAMVVMTACAAPAPVLTSVPVFRDPSAQIASQTNVTAARMAGDWVIRQSFATDRMDLRAVEFSVLPNGALQMTVPNDMEVCFHGVCTDGGNTLVLYEKSGPGRWMPVDPPAGVSDAELWVMWMDFDDRTAAIGTPDGQFGFIMDKSATGGGDRITAARDIMAWFGYTVDQLKEISP